MKFKVFLITLILFFLSSFSTLAAGIYDGAETFPVPYENVYKDASGNTYFTGSYYGSIDFDPSGGQDIKTAAGTNNNNIYVSKINSAGVYQWTISLGNNNYITVDGLAVDSSGNVYFSGLFGGLNYDFNADPGVTNNLNSSGASDYAGYVSKYNSSGIYQWAVSNNAGNSSASETTYDIKIDTDDSLLAVTSVLHSLTSTTRLTKLNTVTGATTWQVTTAPAIEGNLLAFDGAHNVYVAGSFKGTNIDFDPGAGSELHTSSSNSFDIFVSKFNSSGTYVKTIIIGGSGTDEIQRLKVDSSNNLYLAGLFDNNIDLDPTATDVIKTGSYQDVFFVKLKNNGDAYDWGGTQGSDGSNYIKGLDFDSSGNIYMIGHFYQYSSTIDFDITDGIDEHTGFGMTFGDYYNLYISKYTNSGSYVGTIDLGGWRSEKSTGLIIDQSTNKINWYGIFHGATDFDPTTSEDIKRSLEDAAFHVTLDAASFTQSLVGKNQVEYVQGANYYFQNIPSKTWPSTNSESVYTSLFNSYSNEIYLAGKFTTIDNQTVSNFAVLDGTSEQVKTVTLNFDDVVNDMFLSSDKKTLYLVGGFWNVNNLPRKCIAAVDVDTLTLKDYDLTVPDYDYCYFYSAAVNTSKGTFYLGGELDTTADGSTYTYDGLSEFNLATGVRTSFNPLVGEDVYTVAINSDNSKLYIGGNYSDINGDSTYSYFTVLNADTGAPIKNINFDDSVRKIKIYNDIAYLAGNFYTIDSGTPQELIRNSAAALDITTDTITNWDPFITIGATTDKFDFYKKGNTIFMAANGMVSADYTKIVDPIAIDVTTGRVMDWWVSPNTGTSSIFEVGDYLYYTGSYAGGFGDNLMVKYQSLNPSGATNTPTNTIAPTVAEPPLATSTPVVPLGQVATPTPAATNTPTPTSSGSVLGTSISNASSSTSSTGSWTDNVIQLGAPDLFQIDTTDTTASLYFTPASSPNSYYFISYGTTSAADQFAVKYNQGDYSGVLNYVINKLNPGTTYYFKIHGGNKNTSGPWSNTRSATTQNSLKSYSLAAKAVITNTPTQAPTSTLQPTPTLVTTTTTSCNQTTSYSYYSLPQTPSGNVDKTAPIVYVGNNNYFIANNSAKTVSKIDNRAKTLCSVSVNGTINTLTTNSDNTIVYIGGNFNQIGGVSAGNIAAVKVADCSVQPLPVSTQNPVTSVSVLGNSMYLAVCPVAVASPTQVPTNTIAPTSTISTSRKATRTPPTSTNTPTNTIRPTNTNTPTNTPTKVPTATITPSSTSTPTSTATITPSNTSTPTPSSTLTPTPSSSPVTALVSPTATPTPIIVDLSVGDTAAPIIGSIIKIDLLTNGSVIIPVANGLITTITTVGDSSLVVGGSFQNVMGADRHNLAMIDTNSNKVLAWNPRPNSFVKQVYAAEDKVMVYGDFTQVSDKSIDQFAVIDLKTGQAQVWLKYCHWWWILLIIQFLLLSVYFFFISGKLFKFWWLIPALISLSTVFIDSFAHNYYLASSLCRFLPVMSSVVLLSLSGIYLSTTKSKSK